MTKTNDIIEYCSEYLKVKDFEDGCFNGLQVEGAKEIRKIITGVTLSQELIESAIEKKAQMILVHHGIFSNQITSPPIIKSFMRERLKMILSNDINLVGYHLPLDAHPEIGNNISLCRLFDLKNIESVDVGFIGELKNDISFEDFIKLVDERIDTKSTYVFGGNEQVKRIAISSGGASPDYEIVKAMGADTFITGDIRENIVREAEEVGINVINAGHYNTEKLGVQNLGELIAKKFGVEVEFVDVPNVF